MKKLLIFLSLSLGVTWANTYTSLIVFGDSQSDIGNMPESSNAGMDQPFYFQGIPYNLYVPFSNPVYGDQDNASDQLFHNLFNASDLPAQPMINHNIRAGRSVNWSQYLFVSLKAHHQLLSDKFIPWAMLYAHPDLGKTKNISVNYAFAGALSTAHCADEGYTEIPDTFCTPEAIFNTQNIYRDHPDDDNLCRAIAVPGTQKQIALFADDLANKRLNTDANTLYIVWSGANDLTKSFLALLHGGTIKAFYQTMTTAVPDLIAGPGNSTVTELYRLGARNIVILNQQNLGLTPESNRLTGFNKTFAERYLNAYLLNFPVLRYNFTLAHLVIALQQRYPDLHIEVVDLQHIFNRASLIPGTPFYKNLGLACQNKNAPTYQAILQGDLVICTDYLYWNRAHMTYQGNRMVAEGVLQALQK
jgi:phospholipase/lecithinase/hemolysin